MVTIRSTTIIAVQRDGETALAGDGQVSIDETIFKSTASKLRVMRDGKVLVGYAGAAADAMALFERQRGRFCSGRRPGDAQIHGYDRGPDCRGGREHGRRYMRLY